MKKFEVKANGLKAKIKIKKTGKKAKEDMYKQLDYAKDQLKYCFKNLEYFRTLKVDSGIEQADLFISRFMELNARFTKTKSEKSKKQIAIDAEYEMYFILLGLDKTRLYVFEKTLHVMENGNELYKPIDSRLFKILLADFYRHIYYAYYDKDINNKFQKYWSHTLDNPDDDRIIELNKKAASPREFCIEEIKKMSSPEKNQEMFEKFNLIFTNPVKAIENFAKEIDEFYSVYYKESPNPLEITRGGSSDERKEERKDIEESAEGAV